MYRHLSILALVMVFAGEMLAQGTSVVLSELHYLVVMRGEKPVYKTPSTAWKIKQTQILSGSFLGDTLRWERYNWATGQIDSGRILFPPDNSPAVQIRMIDFAPSLHMGFLYSDERPAIYAFPLTGTGHSSYVWGPQLMMPAYLDCSESYLLFEDTGQLYYKALPLGEVKKVSAIPMFSSSACCFLDDSTIALEGSGKLRVIQLPSSVIVDSLSPDVGFSAERESRPLSGRYLYLTRAEWKKRNPEGTVRSSVSCYDRKEKLFRDDLACFAGLSLQESVLEDSLLSIYHVVKQPSGEAVRHTMFHLPDMRQVYSGEATVDSLRVR